MFLLSISNFFDKYLFLQLKFFIFNLSKDNRIKKQAYGGFNNNASD